MKGFSIIIVSWNALELLQEYLPSVAATNYPDFEIIIANNASNDGSVEWVRRNFPQIKIATFDQNYGYCGGNNRAFSFAGKEILVFLNNDVKVEPNWLHALNFCFEDEKVAAVQPKIKSVLKPEHFEYAGAAGGFIDKYGYPFCRGRIFDEVEKDQGQYDDETDIFWASGAALAIRKDLFLQFDGFDEDFEFHMEEIDLCWRLQNSGYKIRYCPKSVVYHLGGGSLPMGSPRKVFYNFRNSLFMLWKNYSEYKFYRRFSARLMMDYAAALKAIINGNVGEFLAVFKAHLYFLRTFGKLNEKRKQQLNIRKVAGNPPAMMEINVVKEYFLSKKKHFHQLLKENHD